MRCLIVILALSVTACGRAISQVDISTRLDAGTEEVCAAQPPAEPEAAVPPCDAEPVPNP